MTMLKLNMIIFDTNRRKARQILKGWEIYYKYKCRRNESKASKNPLKHMGRISGR